MSLDTNRPTNNVQIIPRPNALTPITASNMSADPPTDPVPDLPRNNPTDLEVVSVTKEIVAGMTRSRREEAIITNRLRDRNTNRLNRKGSMTEGKESLSPLTRGETHRPEEANTTETGAEAKRSTREETTTSQGKISDKKGTKAAEVGIEVATEVASEGIGAASGAEVASEEIEAASEGAEAVVSMMKSRIATHSTRAKPNRLRSI